MSIKKIELRKFIILGSQNGEKSFSIKPEGISKSTFYRLKKRFTEIEIPCEELLTKTDSELNRLFYPDKFVESSIKIYIPDFEMIAEIINDGGGRIDKQYKKYVEECRQLGMSLMPRSTFYSKLKSYLPPDNLTMRIIHKPGEIMEVDWAGKCSHVLLNDRKTIKAHFFVAVLPYSSLIFVKAYENEKITNFLDGIKSSLNWLGGTPRILTIDNLKSGVTRYDRHDPTINNFLNNLSKHYGLCVNNTRIASPKDKPTVERSVNLSYDIINDLVKSEYFSLEDFNKALINGIESLNEKIQFNGKIPSRRCKFDQEEKPFLKPLPSMPFINEKLYYRIVQRDYHISFDGKYYSTPYKLSGKKVQVYVSESLIRIMHDGVTVATHHKILTEGEKYSTLTAHRPKKHLMYLEMTPEKILNNAEIVGPNVLKVIESKIKPGIDNQPMELKSCRGIINLAYSGNWTFVMVDKACETALKSYKEDIKKEHILQILEKQEREGSFTNKISAGEIVHVETVTKHNTDESCHFVRPNLRSTEYYKDILDSKDD